MISIVSIASLSAIGSSSDDINKAYRQPNHFLNFNNIEGISCWTGTLQKKDKKFIEKLRNENKSFRHLDNTVLYAIFCGKKAFKQSNWKTNSNFGINIGSSRGATSLFEKYHKSYLETKKVSTYTSPSTTLGNISSWLAHELNSTGVNISHSITCATGLQALLNGIAWLNSKMCDKFIIGASEAPLTGFTISQMKALKIYSDANKNEQFPCKAFDIKKEKNTVVLGEGASVLCLEKGKKTNALAYIKGIGFATETLTSGTSISSDAQCIQKSMYQASKGQIVDAIVTHTPGTLKGDSSEYKAIQKVFGTNIPLLTNNKWKIGHTFAPSGLLSLEFAIWMLVHQQFVPIPYLNKKTSETLLKNILVNAIGFGGNAVSILVAI